MTASMFTAGAVNKESGKAKHGSKWKRCFVADRRKAAQCSMMHGAFQNDFLKTTNNKTNIINDK